MSEDMIERFESDMQRYGKDKALLIQREMSRDRNSLVMLILCISASTFSTQTEVGILLGICLAGIGIAGMLYSDWQKEAINSYYIKNYMKEED